MLDSGSTPFSTWLQMEYSIRDFYIYFRIIRSPHSNGHCHVEVKANRKLVFKAHGDYIAEPVITNVQRYEPGFWERRIRRVA